MNMNEKPFEYETREGIIFKCKRSDLSIPIMVSGLPLELHSGNLSAALRAVAEMAAYHRGVVLPNLNGVVYYDSLHFEVYEEDEDQDTVLTTSRDEVQEREEDSRICMDSISPLGTYTGTI